MRRTERYPEATVLTLDGDFRIYRRHGRHVVPHVSPDHVPRGVIGRRRPGRS